MVLTELVHAMDGRAASWLAPLAVRLVDKSPEEQLRAFRDLTARIWNGGDVATIAPALVPALVDELRWGDERKRARCALLLGLLASSASSSASSASSASSGSSERASAGRARAAVRAALPDYLELALDLESRRDRGPLRQALLYLLGQFLEDRELILGRMLEVMRQLTPQVTASGDEDRTHFKNALNEPDFSNPEKLRLELLQAETNVPTDAKTLRRIWLQFRAHALAYLGAKAYVAARATHL